MNYSINGVYYRLYSFSIERIKCEKKEEKHCIRFMAVKFHYLYQTPCAFPELYFPHDDLRVFVMAVGCHCSPLLDILINKLICNIHNPSTYGRIEQLKPSDLLRPSH